MDSYRCWICDSNQITLVHDGIDSQVAAPQDFSITDDRYGTTLSIYRCSDCSFEFCPQPVDLVSMYAEMKDQDYVDSSKSRSIQAQKLARLADRFINRNSVTLDVGCGSGLLVRELQNRGHRAYGLEPSSFLSSEGIKRQMQIYQGTFDDYAFAEDFNLVSLIDVIEHVQDPRKMLSSTHKALQTTGVLLLVTPRRDSLIRKLLGFKWWHYRVAHVAYFSKANIMDLLHEVGFDVLEYKHATWFLPLDYILNRVMKYIPGLTLNFNLPFEIPIPINLFDSSMIIAKKRSLG